MHTPLTAPIARHTPLGLVELHGGGAVTRGQQGSSLSQNVPLSEEMLESLHACRLKILAWRRTI